MALAGIMIRSPTAIFTAPSAIIITRSTIPVIMADIIQATGTIHIMHNIFTTVMTGATIITVIGSQ